MIDLIPARKEMLAFLNVQPAQALVGTAMSEAMLEEAIRGGIALAAVQDGKLLALGGVWRVWEDRGLAWTLLGCSIRNAMPAVHRVIQRGLDASPQSRIEAYVAGAHEEGHRWMGMLGFEREGVMRKFWQGGDYTLYARVR